MIIKTEQTLVFEYPEDYQAEVEWNKKRDGDWVHKSTDTMCAVYTLTNSYIIPTAKRHSFVDNAKFDTEQTEPCDECVFVKGSGWCDNCNGKPKGLDALPNSRKAEHTEQNSSEKPNNSKERSE